MSSGDITCLYNKLDDERKCLICLDKEFVYQKSKLRDCEDICVLLQNETESKTSQLTELETIKNELKKAVQCLKMENQKLNKVLLHLNADISALMRLGSSMFEKVKKNGI